jgi:hypothetical protein
MGRDAVSINYRMTVPGYLLNPPATGSLGSVSSSSCVTAVATSHLSTLSATSSTGAQPLLFPASITNGFLSSLCQRIAAIWNKFCTLVSSCFSGIYRYIESCVVTPFPKVNQDMSKETLKKLYWGLGKQNKWRECIDGCHHHLGKHVYDKGLHGGTVEPGYVVSMENRAFPFVESSLGQKIDADWYLNLHRQTCAHFTANSSAVLMGQEGVGVFRDTAVCCSFKGRYQISSRAKAEFDALDASLKKEFGPTYGLGEVVYPNALSWDARIDYKKMQPGQIRQIFNKFLNEFYAEVERAATPDAKLTAIAKLQQRLEWLHPVKDGTSRTDTVLMNKLLTDHGFHPAILEYPHVFSSYTLADWKRYLQNGLIKWEQERAKLQSTV